MNRGNTRALARDLDLLFGGGTAVGLPDGDLLARFVGRSGKPAELAFAALVARHGPMVLRVCRRVLTDPHDVEDAFQATFLVLVERADSIRTRDSVASWLHGVAFRVASCARATAARRRRLEASRPEQESPTGREDDQRELRLILQEEIARLPDRYRAALVLCDLEGHSYDEAARQLVWPIGTVKSRLARARQQLRTRLVRRGVAPAALALGAVLSGEAATSLPSVLLQSTVRAAIDLAAGRPLPPGAIPASVVALTEGVLKTMFLTKLKTAALTLLVLGALATGAAVKGQGDGDAKQKSEPDRLRDIERKINRLIEIFDSDKRPREAEGRPAAARPRLAAPRAEGDDTRPKGAPDRPERDAPRPRAARSLRDAPDREQPGATIGRAATPLSRDEVELLRRVGNDRIGVLERRVTELETRLERFERRLDAVERRGTPAVERRGVDKRASDRGTARRAAARDAASGSRDSDLGLTPEPASDTRSDLSPAPRDPSKR